MFFYWSGSDKYKYYQTKVKFQHKCLKCKQTFSSNKQNQIFCGGDKCDEKPSETF